MAFQPLKKLETIKPKSRHIEWIWQCILHFPPLKWIKGNSTIPLFIWTWFLKNQFGKIKSISNLIFSACVACKHQFWNWFLQAKNPVHRTWFFQLAFSKLKYRETGGMAFKSSWWNILVLVCFSWGFHKTTKAYVLWLL